MTLPHDFVEQIKTDLQFDFEAFVSALEQDAPTSIRVNDKTPYVPSDQQVEWCSSGYYLPSRPLFTADPLFHAGAYYVQEASSMFLTKAVEQFFPEAASVLDLCAAPGGKSTLLSQRLSKESLLVSNEVVRSRAYILAENLMKWGNPNVIVTNNEPADFEALPSFFDAIVVDAPCSGEGMFRKDERAIQEWSLANVEMCALRQRDILTDVWDTLKTDGILVYSTCTYNTRENEENVRWICSELGAEVLKIDLGECRSITVTDEGYRFFPHKTRGEGFFLSVMRKTSDSGRKWKPKIDKSKTPPTVFKNSLLPVALLRPNEWEVMQFKNNLYAYPTVRLAEYLFLIQQLNIVHSGVLLGELKGASFIPSACSALSKILNTENIPMVEVDYATAIQFLKAEAIQLPLSERGYLLVCYKSVPLGWVKNVGNRCNNLYPRDWRIRMNL